MDSIKIIEEDGPDGGYDNEVRFDLETREDIICEDLRC